MPFRSKALLCLLLTIPAHAVIIHGRVTTPLGSPIPGARVQLIQGRLSVGDAVTGLDGSYEIRSSLSGRFVLLATAAFFSRTPSVQIGHPFYAGRVDQLTFDIALDSAAITPQLSGAQTRRETPIPQLASAVTQLRPDQLVTQATLIPELRETPGVLLLERGPFGTPAFLYLRGADPAATKFTIEGVPAEDLGGRFDLRTLSTTGLASFSLRPPVELTPGASPLAGHDAEAGQVALRTTRAGDLHPTLTYTGDAGNLHNLRDEAVATLTHTRTDLLGAASRFDTSNETPATPFHLATATANLGYHISGGTSVRVTVRRDVSAGPPPSPLDFFGVAPSGRLADQDLYGGFTFETRTSFDWHNQVRYGLVRKREQNFNYFTPLTGHPVVITGANGATATGTATFPLPPGREDAVTDRDEYSYETDYQFAQYLAASATVRYEAERGADLTPALRQTLDRNHLSFSGGLQGDIHHRVYYEASGLLDHADYGLRGAPRLGLTYSAVRPGPRPFHGTTLHATAATGFREPGVLEAAAALDNTPRSRTIDASVDQNILQQKLVVRATYFHNQFSHEVAPLTVTPVTYTPGVAYRTQGLELETRYQPFPHVQIRGGYTYLASLVEQSTVAAAANPNLPGVAIGGLSALVGARPFHRPPQTGYTTAEYTGRAVTGTLKASFASRSDDSTGLLQSPALLLPNRDLSPGWFSLDANASYAATRHITIFTQLLNVTDNRHLAPIGFRSTPFSIRSGLRIRLGRE